MIRSGFLTLKAVLCFISCFTRLQGLETDSADVWESCIPRRWDFQQSSNGENNFSRCFQTSATECNNTPRNISRNVLEDNA